MKNYLIVLDTETAPIDNTVETVNPFNMLVYDIGWVITDRNGVVYKKRSFVNADIYVREREKMRSAYYANKLPQYEDDLRAGKRELRTLYTIYRTFLADIDEYKVKEVYAHNARFDYCSANKTREYCTNNRFHYFFPKNLTICDTLKMARQVVAKTPTYKKFCEENGFMTKNNQVRLTAEVLYRYITKNIDFEEAHTGLEDVLIEKEIMRYCFAKHQKMDRVLYAPRE